MTFEKGSVMTLNDNKNYVVVEKTIYNDKQYVYLIDKNDFDNVMFLEFDGDKSLTEVNDTKLIQKLIVAFAKE